MTTQTLYAHAARLATLPNLQCTLGKLRAPTLRAAQGLSTTILMCHPLGMAILTAVRS